MEQIGNYTLIKQIGGGNYGKVYLAKNTSQAFFAIKKIETRGINKKLLSLIENEVAILSVTNNKGILKLIESIQQDNNIYIITEYCSGGDLEKLLNKCRTIPVHIAKRWLKRIIQALSDLRKQNIIHRDIKIANLMLTDPDPEKADIKIGDFGFSKFLGQSLTSTQLGTPLYMAPEIFNTNHYNYKIDIWSLGVVAYEIIFGKPPFQCFKLEELRQLQRKQILFPESIIIEEEAKDVIRAMLTYDPDQRFDYDQLLQMPFFIEEDKLLIPISFEDKKLDEEYEMIEKDVVGQESEEEYEDLLDDKKSASDLVEENKEEILNQKCNFEEEKISHLIISDARLSEKPQVPLISTQSIYLSKQQAKIPEEIPAKMGKIEASVNEIPKNSVRMGKIEISAKENIEKNNENNRSQQEIQNLLLQHEHKEKLIEEVKTLESTFSKIEEILYGISKYVHGNFSTMWLQIGEINSRYPQNEYLGKVFSEKFDFYQFQIIDAEEKIENLKKTLKGQANDMVVQGNIIDQAYTYLQNSDLESKKIAFTLLNVGYYLYPENEIILEALSTA
ncbi:hypothetical protein SteCoe_4429 [Stentor coeruleus]|uniref:Protein kinase domain-containing protein n=1 Tax=Stentor coeruleus TaxID=5963 RepID=A0A1R2CUV8_9CILI|nr:hypothetical protein SteCoe_4429 [Stentor coeruleus]